VMKRPCGMAHNADWLTGSNEGFDFFGTQVKRTA
jgi:hypothetical protein